jgi:hypothetical protein
LDLLELLFGLRVVLIQIGMILSGQAAICFLDFFGRGSALDAENRVIVFCHGGGWNGSQRNDGEAAGKHHSSFRAGGG